MLDPGAQCPDTLSRTMHPSPSSWKCCSWLWWLIAMTLTENCPWLHHKELFHPRLHVLSRFNSQSMTGGSEFGYPKCWGPHWIRWGLSGSHIVSHCFPPAHSCYPHFLRDIFPKSSSQQTFCIQLPISKSVARETNLRHLFFSLYGQLTCCPKRNEFLFLKALILRNWFSVVLIQTQS